MSTVIAAKVVADSVSPARARITTLQLVFPRIILAEFNTHRMFSRNAASSRAIPVKKMLEQVRNDPFIPTYWGKNQPGMQADEALSPEDRDACRAMWLEARTEALRYAGWLNDRGLHKQLANRPLEPWMWTHVVVTATEWANFFNLRLHPAAQPEMRELAECIQAAIQASKPTVLDYGAWHLPYVSPQERGVNLDVNLRRLSVARCARVSYMNHDGTVPNAQNDIELHDQLLSSGHFSPFEHQATPIDEGFDKNFYCWRQYRSEF